MRKSLALLFCVAATALVSGACTDAAESSDAFADELAEVESELAAASAKADSGVYAGPPARALNCRSPNGTVKVINIDLEATANTQLQINVRNGDTRITRTYSSKATQFNDDLEVVTWNHEGLEGMLVVSNFYKYPGARAYIGELVAFYDLGGKFVCARQ